MTAEEVKKALKVAGDPEKAELLMRYFKTGKGGYGEGDIFLGLKVPDTRAIAKQYRELLLNEVEKILDSQIHEERLCALEILVFKMEKAKTEADKKKLFDFYLGNTKYINNWDLVDLSARKIVGEYLLYKNRSILKQLARSTNVWEKRIAIIATQAFIKDSQYTDTLEIAEILLNDTHDLIHKAVGWMLREVGNKDRHVEEVFLKKHYKTMPRTMLRYAIEKFPEEIRKQYLAGTVT